MARGESGADGQPSSAAPSTVRVSRKRRKFYLIEDQPAHDFPYDFLNERLLGSDGGWWGSGLRHYPETPVFRSVNGNTNRDFWRYSFYWFISDRMKTVLESVDPGAFEFLKCKVQLPDGTDGPVRWMCDIVRVLDALNEEESTVITTADGHGQKMYQLLTGNPLIFKNEVVGSHHIFRMKYAEPTVICDEEVRLACKAAGLKGTSFQEVGRRQNGPRSPKR